MNRTLLLAALFGLSAMPMVMAGTSLPYGSEPGQVAYLNASSAAGNIGTPLPLGPQAFRVVGSDTWVTDSLKGRIYRVDGAGRVAATIQAIPAGTPAMLGDLAIATDAQGKPVSLWVTNRHTQEVIQLSVEGKTLQTLGGTATFRDVSRLEVGASGNLYVADLGHNRLFVFGPDGKALRDLPWSGCGFCLDRKEQLHLLNWDQTAGKAGLATFDAAGKALGEKPLQLPIPTEPRLWFLTPGEEIVLTFFRADLPPGTQQMARCKLTGDLVGTQEVPVPEGMNRFLDLASDGTLWVGQADFDAAPQGTFTIVPLVITKGIPQG